MTPKPASLDLRGAMQRSYPPAAASGAIRAGACLDAAFDCLLHAMAEAETFDLRGMCFKGGTALRKYRFGHPSRFSYDLDFNLAPGGASPADAAALIGDAAASSPNDDFEFEVVERRGHYGLVVGTQLLDELSVGVVSFTAWAKRRVGLRWGRGRRCRHGCRSRRGGVARCPPLAAGVPMRDGGSAGEGMLAACRRACR